MDKEKIRRVFHLLHLRGDIFQLVDEKKEQGKRDMSLYSLVCDSDVRVTKQIQNNVIPDCKLKFGIKSLTKISEITNSNKEKIELYVVIVDIANSNRVRVELNDKIGKWTLPNKALPPEPTAQEWVSTLKTNNAWTIVDLLTSSDEKFNKIIEENKVINPV